MRKYLEQLRYKRRPVNLNAEVGVEVKKGDTAKKYLLPVKVINLSLQGCCFITHTVLLNGKHLFLDDIGSKDIEIRIYLPKNLIKILAKVIWFDYAEEYRGFKVGLSFDFMKDSNPNFLKQYLSLKDSAIKK
ncbi:MAG: PilZ domain-containing protein [Deltaproteobacteria bacterium]|nr:PilZ domain-containing protein [Deltaproteobacteria bacterium]MBW1719635.1 PilZ domain-containing protein [Deltaproteobacteria bacterium]MBW1938332.1 PilZ domain-containing protein [Deltaproteobacteria bacterium]MBW1965152.1 PilZ domain-containing protein [Deltaproteobacteria bacterium]MBW2081195.1 PilZ domain-containing protein [Deltaproteobacteria bacterium]